MLFCAISEHYWKEGFHDIRWNQKINRSCAVSPLCRKFTEQILYFGTETISVSRTLYLTLVYAQNYAMRLKSGLHNLWNWSNVRKESRGARASLFWIYHSSAMSAIVRDSNRLDLIPLCYWHEFLDLVFYFECVNGIININGNILPSIQIRQRATRSADPDCLKFTTPKCRIATFQRSFISRGRLYKTLNHFFNHYFVVK
jgi:hypothetical protein